MDYQDDTESGSWYDNSVDSDAQFAAQLQRQFDDEDLLTAQMTQSFNFVRPSISSTHSSNTASNSSNDREIAKRLQRKFYLDLKKQGLSDVHIASMLDTLTPQSDQVDEDLQNALRASLDDSYVPSNQSKQPHSFLEKFVLTLYTNCCYEHGAKAVPPSNDDFSVFREMATKSVKDMSDEMLISVKRIVEMLLEVLNSAREWNEIESAFFIINSISSQMHNPDLKLTNEQLVNFITSVPSTSNPLLINTAIDLVRNLSHWLYTNKEAAIRCVNWLLNLGPDQNFILNVSRTLEKLTSLMHVELAESFPNILELLSYIDGNTENYAETEETTLNLTRACTYLTNNRSCEEMVACLEALLHRPIYALSEILAHNNQRSDQMLPTNDSNIWLNRIFHIYKTLCSWNVQKECLNLKFGCEYPSAPWSALNQGVCQILCQLMSAHSNDQMIVENCCRCCMALIDSDFSNGSTILISKLLNELLAIYNQGQQSQLYVLQIANKVIDDYTVGIDAEQIISNFLNSVCIYMSENYSNIDDVREHSELIRYLFASVNSFTRLRITSFVEQPAAQLMFELATIGLAINENELNKYSRSFISMLLQFPRSHTAPELIENIQLIINSCVEKLIDTCLQIALFQTNVDLINSAAEVLSELFLVENQKIDPYLRTCINRLISPYRVPTQAISEFEMLLKRSSSPEDVLQAFIVFSGYIRQ